MSIFYSWNISLAYSQEVAPFFFYILVLIVQNRFSYKVWVGLQDVQLSHHEAVKTTFSPLLAQLPAGTLITVLMSVWLVPSSFLVLDLKKNFFNVSSFFSFIFAQGFVHVCLLLD